MSTTIGGVPGFQPYNAGALGPSKASLMDTTVATDNVKSNDQLQQATQTLGQDQTTYNRNASALTSSLGASGRLFGSAGATAMGNLGADLTNQQHDVRLAFNSAQNDLSRQQAFAAIGLII